MQQIRFDQQFYTGPSKWEDLKAADLLQIALITSMTRFRELIPYYLVFKLYKLPKRFWKLRESQLIQTKACLSWMEARNSLYSWLIASVTVDGREYFGPKNRLADLTVEEFMFAEKAYQAWLDNDDKSMLASLFAALYRRKKIFSNLRRPFNENHFNRLQNTAESIKPHVLKAIALNYAGCRNLIIDRHPDIWKKPADDEQPKSTSAARVNWPSLALELSGDKFGTYNETIKMNIWIFLADMNKKAKQVTELEGNI